MPPNPTSAASRATPLMIESWWLRPCLHPSDRGMKLYIFCEIIHLTLCIGSNCPGISGTFLAFVPGPGTPYLSPIVCPGSKLDSCNMSRFYTTGDQNEPYHV